MVKLGFERIDQELGELPPALILIQGILASGKTQVLRRIMRANPKTRILYIPFGCDVRKLPSENVTVADSLEARSLTSLTQLIQECQPELVLIDDLHFMALPEDFERGFSWSRDTMYQTHALSTFWYLLIQKGVSVVVTIQRDPILRSDGLSHSSDVILNVSRTAEGAVLTLVQNSHSTGDKLKQVSEAFAIEPI